MSGPQPHSRKAPCPICGGHRDQQPGKGVRCFGFVSSDGEWVHCTREELAGRAKFHDKSQTYSHKLRGRCPCGVEHNPAAPGDAPPTRRSGGEVRQIGEAAREIVATYDYKAKDGRLLYQVVRYQPKNFRQRRPHPNKSGEWVWHMGACADSRSACGCGLGPQPTTLYRIPELLQAIEAGDDVWIVEGEKDVESLMKAGQTATCNTGGAGKWRQELARAFAGMEGPQRIRIVQDKDEPGVEHARAVFASLQEVVKEGVTVEIVEAISGKDATDHLAAGHGTDAFALIWPLPENYAEIDPLGFKQLMLRQAKITSEKALERVDPDAPMPVQPTFPVGLIGESPTLRTLQGATVLSGAPSSGKSYLAISTALDACAMGWEVFYLSAEMHNALVRDRAARAQATHGASEWNLIDNDFRAAALENAQRGRLPETFHTIDVGIGVTLDALLEHLIANMTARPTLVIFDSLSSFVDNMVAVQGSDTFKMADLREVMKWIVNVRRLTSGKVAFLLLSELNREGRAKGRFVDHRCDVAISMRPDEDAGSVKHIAVTKSWWGPTGTVGAFFLDWEMGRLRRSSSSA